MTKNLRLKTLCLSAILACLPAFEAKGALVTNGGFESGFTGWTRVDQIGSEGSFALQTGLVSPVTGTAVPAPPGGSNAAMTDAQGPGSHVLYQTISMTAVIPSAVLVFDIYVGNRAGTFFTPGSLDFATPTLNQQARVDILAPGSDPFSMAAADILQNVYLTALTDQPVSGYTRQAVNITSVLNANLNRNLILRFAETDNVFTFQLGVDNVDVQLSNIPEPSTWLMSIGALAALGWARKRQVR